MRNKLFVSFPPHKQDKASIRSMTFATIAALSPAILVSVFVYGFRAVVILVLGMLAAVAAEAGINRIMHKPSTIHDGTALLTGLLLAMLMPPGMPWWGIVIGAAVAIFLGKMVFGGLGASPFNAVLVGWVVLRLSWPDAVSTFYEPTPLWEGWARLYAVDFSELPLGLLKYGEGASVMDMYDLGALLIGNVPGAIGATSVVALLAGGIFLVAARVTPWQIPTGFLGGMLIFGGIFWYIDPNAYSSPIWHAMFGYSLLGAFFLAPDTATSPYTFAGMILFGAGAGILNLIIRYWGTYQDGVVFAILFLNALTPVLDRIKSKSYGQVQAA
jgi:electron transport complex protein RnfD